MDQRSPEWFAARLGRVTASRVADVMATTKSGPAASRANYLAELVLERMTGQPAERFQNAAMQWGTETEPQARAAYEFLTDAAVEEVGFVVHPNIPMFGASPDGLVGGDGLIEIKSPNTPTHLATLLGSPIDRKYVLQMQTQMLCTGRAWCDFVSYDPRLPAAMRTFVQRVPRDDKLAEEIETAVGAFIAEVGATVMKLSRLYKVTPALAMPIAAPPGLEEVLA